MISIGRINGEIRQEELKKEGGPMFTAKMEPMTPRPTAAKMKDLSRSIEGSALMSPVIRKPPPPK